MSKIINQSKRNNPVIKAVRGTLEHRAQWLYLLLKEAEKKGVKWEDIGYEATKNCGHIQGKDLTEAACTKSFKGLKKKLFTLSARMVFDMKILKSTDEELSIDFGYCPLVKAWQKLGCTDSEIERLCDIAMNGDRGIGEAFGGRMELGETIAKGNKKCQIRFKKN